MESENESSKANVATRIILPFTKNIFLLAYSRMLKSKYSFPGKEEIITHATYSTVKRVSGTNIPQNFPLLYPNLNRIGNIQRLKTENSR